MSYKSIILLAGCIAADLITSSIIPGIAPIFLVIIFFFLAKRVSLTQVLIMAICAGFIFDLSQNSGTIFATVFLSIQATVIHFLNNKYIDLTNRITEIIFFFIIFLVKIILVWIVYDRLIQSNFLRINLIYNLIAVILISLVILLKNAKKTKIF